MIWEISLWATFRKVSVCGMCNACKFV